MMGFALIVTAAVVVLVAAVLLHRRKLREKYTFLWLIVGMVVLLLAVFPGILRWASKVAGVQVPSNLLFAVAILFLAAVCLHLSLEVTALEDESRILAEEIAILRAQFDHFRAGDAGGNDTGTHEGGDSGT